MLNGWNGLHEMGACPLCWLGNRRWLAGPIEPCMGEGQVGRGWDSAEIDLGN
jgi:hypothetical protein